MIILTAKDFIELIVGFIFIWIGIYILSKDPFKRLYWIIFAMISSFGFTIFADSILLQTQNVQQYIFWQKITDWPLFFAPIFYYHFSLYFKNTRSKFDQTFLFTGYILAASFYFLDVRGGLILQETLIRNHNFRRMDGFAPGILLLPSIAFVTIYMLKGVFDFGKEIKKNFWRNFLPQLSGIILSITAVMIGCSYYTYLKFADIFYNVGVSLAVMILIYSIIKKYVLEASSPLFDRAFAFKTLAVFGIIAIYLSAFKVSGASLDFPTYVLGIIIVLLVAVTHILYDWVSTFVSDFIYNVSFGLSLVTDEEVYSGLKNYNKRERLEDSSLLRLNIINQNVHKGMLPVDALRAEIEECIEYFKPTKDESKRTKTNLKYHLLKMLTYEDAEEGQILWELGFEDYPVAIMTRENRARGPIFKVSAPSDYYFTSRNAYLALKKEAIHDIAWRLSYLEKSQKSRKFL